MEAQNQNPNEAPPPSSVAGNCCTEAGVVMWFTMIDADGNEQSITLRASKAANWPTLLEETAKIKKQLLEAGWRAKGSGGITPQNARAARDNAPQSRQEAPRRAQSGGGNAPQQGGGNEIVMPDKINLSQFNGKDVFKVKYGNNQKFGVPLYPEAMADLGIDDAEFDNYADYPWRWAEVEIWQKNGKPYKAVAVGTVS